MNDSLHTDDFVGALSTGFDCAICIHMNVSCVQFSLANISVYMTDQFLFILGCEFKSFLFVSYLVCLVNRKREEFCSLFLAWVASEDLIP